MTVAIKPYPAYKDSGVPWLGKVPEHWEVLPGRTLFREINERDHPNEELLSVTISHGVVRQTDLLSDSSKKDSSNEDKSAYKLVEPGDIAYNKMRAWQGAVGTSAYRGIVSPAYIVQRLRNPRNSPRYIHYLLRTPYFTTEAERWSYGITSDQWSLRAEDFKNIYFSVPGQDEQTAIVRFLDWADGRIKGVIRAREKRIKLLKEYKQALIHQAVTGQIDVRTGKPYPKYKDSLSACGHAQAGGVEWLGKVPEHWEVRKLKYLVSFTGGGTPSKAISAFWEGTIPWVSPKDMKSTVIADTVDHINEESIESSATSLISEGAMLLVVRSGILRRHIPVAINSVPVALNQDMKALRPKPNLLTTHYLYLIVKGCESLLLDEWTKKGATVESIEHEFLANSRLPLPPLPEQTNIVEFLNKQTEKIGAAISADRRVIELLKEFRTRLIADVVTGKVDVREVAKTLPGDIEYDSPETDGEDKSLKDLVVDTITR